MTPEESNQSLSKPCLFNYFFWANWKGFWVSNQSWFKFFVASPKVLWDKAFGKRAIKRMDMRVLLIWPGMQ